MSNSRPLSARPLDALYILFFISHIPATLFCDLPSLLPPHLIPFPINRINPYYLNLSRDPLISGVRGLNGAENDWVWFRSLLLLEIVYQLPIFFVGLIGLWKDKRAVYPVLLAYSAAALAAFIPCLAVLLTTPTAPTLHAALSSPQFTITSDQRVLLLASYIPFALVPLIMAIDMTSRVTRLVRIGITAEGARKMQ